MSSRLPFLDLIHPRALIELGILTITENCFIKHASPTVPKSVSACRKRISHALRYKREGRRGPARGALRMALAMRFVPNPGRSIIRTPSGRAYPVTGATVDITFPDADAIHLDQATKLMVIGATADRPANNPARINWPPPIMYDTTRGGPIFLVPGSNPARWVNITGAVV